MDLSTNLSEFGLVIQTFLAITFQMESQWFHGAVSR